MDYESEQSMELEALEAIFADHLEEFEGNTPEGWSKHGKTWAITILPSAGACTHSSSVLHFQDTEFVHQHAVAGS
jgi:hypothetical protein